MLVFSGLIFYTYVIAPAFGLPSAPIPSELWTLLQIGMGGYIVARSAEKVSQTLKTPTSPKTKG